MASRLPEFYIDIDSAEKMPWSFDLEDKKPGEPRILGSEVTNIDAGDYRIKNANDLIVIEKKAGFSEIFGNYSPSENKERFHRELERLRPVKFKYLLIEGLLSKDNLSLSVPQFSQGKAPPLKRVVEWLEQLEMEYDIRVKFVGDCGNKYAKMLFRNAARKYL